MMTSFRAIPWPYARVMDPNRQLGIDAVRAWRARCLMPLALVLLHVFGVSVDDTALRQLATASGAVLVLTHAWTYVRLQAANDTSNSVTVEEECLTFAEYDARAVKQLASSTLIALATAWFLHQAKVVSSLLTLQCVLLPLSVWDAEAVRLHLWREDPSRPCLQRPWPSETDKAFAACVSSARVLRRVRCGGLTGCAHACPLQQDARDQAGVRGAGGAGEAGLAWNPATRVSRRHMQKQKQKSSIDPGVVQVLTRTRRETNLEPSAP